MPEETNPIRQTLDATRLKNARNLMEAVKGQPAPADPIAVELPDAENNKNVRSLINRASVIAEKTLDLPLREIKEPVKLDVKFDVAQIVRNVPLRDLAGDPPRDAPRDADSPAPTEPPATPEEDEAKFAALNKAMAMANYMNIANSVAKITPLLKLEQLRLEEVKSLPKELYGYLTYGITAADAKPLRNARVKVSGISTMRLSGLKGDVTGVEVVTDGDGFYHIELPSGTFCTGDALTLRVAKGSIYQNVSLDKNEVKAENGEIKTLLLKKAFEAAEGLMERLDNAVYSIASMFDESPLEEAPADGQPKVMLGEGENSFALTWAGSAISKHSFKLLHRLIEPELIRGDLYPGRQNYASDFSLNRPEYVQRQAINLPLDVAAFKRELAETPRSTTRMTTLGMGYILGMRQEWKPTNFSLGTLLYSLALAPGEEQRLIVTESADTYAVRDDEALSDTAAETYRSEQSDDTTAIYESAMHEQIEASSRYEGKEKGSGGGALFGLFASVSKTTVSGSSSSEQDYSRDFASSFTESFNEQIQRSAQRSRQASRVGIRMATSEESRSISSKIIANNNHMHALTMQYWEVLRNYTIETKVDDVQLVCYIPMELIQFLPLQFRNQYLISPNELMALGSNKDMFNQRYEMLLRHHDAILRFLPYKYRTGLETLKTFSTYPAWNLDTNFLGNDMQLSLKVTGTFLPFDELKANIVLKNGRRISGFGAITPLEPKGKPTNRDEVMQMFKSLRQNLNTVGGSLEYTFLIPGNVKKDELAYLELVPGHKLSYTYVSPYESAAVKQLEKQTKLYGEDSVFGKIFASLWAEALKEQEKLNTHRLSMADYGSIGAVQYAEIELKEVARLDDGASSTTSLISCRAPLPPAKPALLLSINRAVPQMSLAQLQSIESTFQHVVENTLHYSQVVWAALTDSERALLLENYTIGLPNAQGDDYGAEIPLMNCLVNTIEGFYGNCMVMPFVYPPALVDLLHSSSKEIQDALFRYHSEGFRPSRTTVSVSTKGMVGEAVLGSSNASEKIDLTRFWNWQDSPIERAPDISLSDLERPSLLEGKAAPSELLGTTNNFTLQDVPITAVPNLAATLAAQDGASGVDFTGRGELAAMLTKLNETSANSRDIAVKAGAELANTAIQAAISAATGVPPTLTPEQQASNKSRAETAKINAEASSIGATNDISAEKAKADAEKIRADAEEANAKADKTKAEAEIIRKTGAAPAAPEKK